MSMLDLVSGFLYANRWLSWVRCRSMGDQCIACRIISVKNFFLKEEGNHRKIKMVVVIWWQTIPQGTGCFFTLGLP